MPIASATRERLSRLAGRLLAMRREAMTRQAMAALLAADGSISPSAGGEPAMPLSSVFMDAVPSDAKAISEYVRLCESRGGGDDALDLLAHMRTRRSARLHPLTLIGIEAAVLMIVVTVFAVVVMPALKTAFDSYGAALPALTRGVFLVVSLLLPVMACVAIALVIGAMWRFVPVTLGPFIRPLDRAMLSLPVIGVSIRSGNSMQMAGWLGFAPADAVGQRAAVEAARLWSTGLLARLCARVLVGDPAEEILIARLTESDGFDGDFIASAALPDRAEAAKAFRARWRLRPELDGAGESAWIILFHFGLGLIIAILVIAMYQPLFKIASFN